MPNPVAFLTAFKLHKNQSFGVCTIQHVKIGHIVVERYKEYKFPLVVQVETANKNSTQTLNDFKRHVVYSIVVNSQYGNPYECWIEGFKIKRLASVGDERLPNIKHFVITCTGVGVRK